MHYSVEGATEGFRNDWLYAKGGLLRRPMELAKLPWDTPLRTRRPDIFEPLIAALLKEQTEPDTLSIASAEALLTRTLIDVARAMRAGAATDNGRLEGFRALRGRVLMELKHPWTVGEMAKSLSLSPERFSSLYRETFGNSPISELIEARMLCAKRLLLQSDMPVKEIAVECGIQDIHYFSRIFKKRCGIPPREFKRLSTRDSKRA